jgi:hypothetical protein
MMKNCFIVLLGDFYQNTKNPMQFQRFSIVQWGSHKNKKSIRLYRMDFCDTNYWNYFLPRIESFAAFATLNFTTFFAGI